MEVAEVQYQDQFSDLLEQTSGQFRPSTESLVDSEWTLQSQQSRWKQHSLSYSIAQRSHGPRGSRAAYRRGLSSQYRDFIHQNQTWQNKYSLEYNLAKRFSSDNVNTVDDCPPDMNQHQTATASAMSFHKERTDWDTNVHGTSNQFIRESCNSLSSYSDSDDNNLSNQPAFEESKTCGAQRSNSEARTKLGSNMQSSASGVIKLYSKTENVSEYSSTVQSEKKDCSALTVPVSEKHTQTTEGEHSPAFHTGIMDQKICGMYQTDGCVKRWNLSEKKHKPVPNISEQAGAQHGLANNKGDTKAKISDCDVVKQTNKYEKDIDLSKIQITIEYLHKNGVRFNENVETLDNDNRKGVEKLKDTCTPGKPMWKKQYKKWNVGSSSSCSPSEQVKLTDKKRLRTSILEDALEKRPVSGENVVLSQRYQNKRENKLDCSETAHSDVNTPREMNEKTLYKKIRQSHSHTPQRDGVKQHVYRDSKAPRKFSFIADELHSNMKGGQNDKVKEEFIQEREKQATVKTSVECTGNRDNICKNESAKLDWHDMADNKKNQLQCFEKVMDSRDSLENMGLYFRQEGCETKCHEELPMKQCASVLPSVNKPTKAEQGKSLQCKYDRVYQASSSESVSMPHSENEIKTTNGPNDTSALDEEQDGFTSTMTEKKACVTSKRPENTNPLIHQFEDDANAMLSQDIRQQEQNQGQQKNIYVSGGKNSSIQYSQIKQKSSRQIQELQMTSYWHNAVDNFLKESSDFFISKENADLDYWSIVHGLYPMYIETPDTVTADLDTDLEVPQQGKDDTAPPVLLPFDGCAEFSQSVEKTKLTCQNNAELEKQSPNKKSHCRRSKPFWETTHRNKRTERQKVINENSKHFIGVDCKKQKNIERGNENLKCKPSDEKVAMQENATGGQSSYYRTETENGIVLEITKGTSAKEHMQQSVAAEGHGDITDEVVSERKSADTIDMKQSSEEMKPTLDKQVSVSNSCPDRNQVAKPKSRRGRKRKKPLGESVDVNTPTLNCSNEKCVKEMGFKKEPKLELIDVVKTFISVEQDVETVRPDTMRENPIGTNCVQHNPIREKNTSLQLLRGKKKQQIGPKTWKSLHCSMKMSKNTSHRKSDKRVTEKCLPEHKTQKKRGRKKKRVQNDPRKEQSFKAQSLSLRENIRTIPKGTLEAETESDNSNGEEVVGKNIIWQSSNVQSEMEENDETNCMNELQVEFLDFSENCGENTVNDTTEAQSNGSMNVSENPKKRPLSKLNVCHFCGKKEASLHSLRIHTEEEHPYRCNKCGDLFPDKASSRHNFWSHVKSPYRCELCDVNFLSEHIRDLHLQKKEHLKREQRQAEMDAAVQSIIEQPSSGITEQPSLGSIEQPNSDPTLEEMTETDILCHIANSFSLFDFYRSA